MSRFVLVLGAVLFSTLANAERLEWFPIRADQLQGYKSIVTNEMARRPFYCYGDRKWPHGRDQVVIHPQYFLNAVHYAQLGWVQRDQQPSLRFHQSARDYYNPRIRYNTFVNVVTDETRTIILRLDFNHTETRSYVKRVNKGTVTDPVWEDVTVNENITIDGTCD